MIGYCESCERVGPSKQDEYNVAVCTSCGTDVATGFHIEEDRYVVSAAEAEDIALAFLNRD